MLISRIAPLLAALTVAACMPPPSSAERAHEAVRQFNIASRFGRLDLALNRTSPGMRQIFAQRRSSWGHELRILDVELASLSIPESDRALALVDFSWTRQSESSLRTTRVLQEWSAKKGGWLLEREQRVLGDLGLFGEVVPAVAAPRHDVQFKTKVISGEIP